jgi:hypothetical protein
MIAPDDVRREIEDATRLRRDIAEMTERLDACKARIRAYAESVGPEERRVDGGSVELESDEGTCTVVFVKDRLALCKGQTAEGLRNVLSDKLWSGLFEFKPALRDGGAQILTDLSTEDRRRLSGLLELRAQESRVTLAK